VCYDTRHRGLDVSHARDPVRDVTLPLLLRNRLAELILDALHDPEARRGLEAVAAVCAGAAGWPRVADLPERAPREFFDERDGAVGLDGRWTEHARELGERSGRASRAIRGRPLASPAATLEATLAAAAVLFDAGLYFEVHELLEPTWMRAGGGEREVLQGLIQIAVGFQHLANGNRPGARALLADGSGKIRGRRLGPLDLDPFARATRACLEQLVALDASAAFDWRAVPRFPGAP